MLIRGQDPSQIVRGNTLTGDGHPGDDFHYAITNPPFGSDWKAEYPHVKAERDEGGSDGRFAPGLPGKDDGPCSCFKLLSKLRPAVDEHGDPIKAGGSRVAIVHNGSPLFSRGAGSGLSLYDRYTGGERPGPDSRGRQRFLWPGASRKRPRRALRPERASHPHTRHTD